MKATRMISRLLAATLVALATGTAAAQDFSWSAYGTLGYAQSNRDYKYLRNINDNGTFETDSVLGAQGDLRFTPQWSATVQVKLQQSLKSDDRWDLTPAWAFLAYRPTNDWLVRAGKMRAPLYLYSESLDVGVTHDMARLPAEMYTLAPSSDFLGLSVAKTWTRGERDLVLDAYSGRIGTTARLWLRDGVGTDPAGARFVSVNVQSSGLVLTLRSPDGIVRGGLHRTSTRKEDGSQLPVAFPFVQIAPGLGYYQVDSRMPGPGVPTVSRIHNTIYTVGLEYTVVPTWRVIGEFERIVQKDTQVGSDQRGGYVALLHNVGRFTPYASWGWVRASEGILDWYDKLTQTQLPQFIPGAAQINAAQRAAGEATFARDQRSFALGTSFAIDARQKVKVEWMHTHIGRVSRLVDTPSGQESPRNTSIETFSINYNFSF